MKLFHKILLGVFCGGVLLTGVGTGVAFTEFSSLTYGGEYQLGKEEMVTEEFDVDIDPEKGKWQIDGYRFDEGIEFVVDESIPENTVRFEITYNKALVKPEIHPSLYGDTWCLEIWCSYEASDEVAMLMEAKDAVLSGLKEGTVPFFTSVQDMKEAVVLVNPANEDDIILY